MDPIEQRIAIAEICGWTCCGQIHKSNPPHGLHPSRNIKNYTTEQLLDHKIPIDTLPDYLNDLNAMHEAEKVFSEKEELRYLSRLMLVINDSSTLGWRKHVCYRATAAERAEAFLRTFDLWK